MTDGKNDHERSTERFPVGKVVGFQGLKGVVKIKPSTNSPELLLEIRDVEIDVSRTESVQFSIDSLKLDKRLLFVTFAGRKSRTDVEHLLGAEVYTTRDQLLELEEDEWWLDDLVGLSVYTTGGRLVGTVSSIIPAASELLEVRTDEPDREPILIPFVKALVPVVDLKARRIEVVELPGLLEP